MKKFKVELTLQAETEAEAAYLWIQQDSPSDAARWWNGLVNAILSLETFPNRCPLAPESEWFDQEIRQRLYGKRAGCFRILFTVRKEKVLVLHIRRSTMQFLEP